MPCLRGSCSAPAADDDDDDNGESSRSRVTRYENELQLSFGEKICQKARILAPRERRKKTNHLTDLRLPGEDMPGSLLRFLRSKKFQPLDGLSPAKVGGRGNSCRSNSHEVQLGARDPRLICRVRPRMPHLAAETWVRPGEDESSGGPKPLLMLRYSHGPTLPLSAGLPTKAAGSR